MTCRTSNLEANLKRELTRLYKLNIGKGPDNTIIRTFNNVVYIRFDGALSQMEQTLLSSEDGKQIVKNIIEELFLNRNSTYVPYIPLVEKILNTTVDEISYVFENKKMFYHYF